MRNHRLETPAVAGVTVLVSKKGAREDIYPAPGNAYPGGREAQEGPGEYMGGR